MKIIAVLGICIIAVALLTGCFGEEMAPVTNLPTLNNDLSTGKLTIEQDVEDFIFVTEYSTPYDTSLWRITDSKFLFMKAYLKSPVDAIVLVEHVHIDINLQSVKARLDGWPQDTMDDKLHTGSQLGFWITDTYPYENIFAIEGFSQTLIDGWGWFIGGYGSLDIDQERLTEKNLVERGGVYGNKIQVVYDILIKYPDDAFYHTRSVVNEFLVPVDY